ncbi:hypothetical protein [Candidatus Lokiarchaeum ossiferum]|uniref:hypothetical protein n=1 Tax=Candidatus Lokiarchaeum ossiferum TaxID=2951803 RepID=UPI00352DF6E9
MEETWKPKPIDLGLSLVIAIAFPFIAQYLYSKTGALIPMILYYSLAWGISKWRRGSTGYFNAFKIKYPKTFLVNVGVIIASLICAYFARIVDDDPNITGVILTALIWATINAASEQLLWIYIFESWDLYLPWIEETKKRNWVYRIFGLLFFSAFVGSIHTLYWVNFLHTVDSTQIFGIIFVLLTTVSGFLHLIVWRKSNQMIFTFIPHFMLNLIPLLWTGYSILPYLLN